MELKFYFSRLVCFQDAHEFLGQCLDQLKEDIVKSVLTEEREEDKIKNLENEERKAREVACPVARNFECQISHTIKCDKYAIICA